MYFYFHGHLVKCFAFQTLMNVKPGRLLVLIIAKTVPVRFPVCATLDMN